MESISRGRDVRNPAGEFASIPGFWCKKHHQACIGSKNSQHFLKETAPNTVLAYLFFPMMQECTVQSRGWGLLMLRWVVDMDLTSAPEKPEFLFFRVYTEAAVSCHVSASGSLNVTGSGERRCLLRASLERNLTEKSHKTSFKEQAEIACLSSSASLSHRHPPPTSLHPPSHLEPSPA